MCGRLERPALDDENILLNITDSLHCWPSPKVVPSPGKQRELIKRTAANGSCDMA